MTRTGPQKIPGASQQYFYGRGVRYTGSDMEVNCGVAHTTEGRVVPSYNNGAEAPTVTGLPDCTAKKIRWYQHYDVDESARALVNKLGGVETNTANAFQVELVGTCDPKTRDAWVKAGYRQDVDFVYWPEAPDWALVEVAWLVRWLHDNHNIPLTCVKDWLAYGKDPRRPGITPASYGASPARMPFETWRTFTGWCGHQHIPENDHGDPGAMDFPRVIALATGAGKAATPTAPAATAPEEGPMPEVLAEKNATVTEIPAGRWTQIAMAADSAVVGGPCAYSVLPQMTITGPPGTRVQAKFQNVTVATGRASGHLPSPPQWIEEDGHCDLAVSRVGLLDPGTHLKLAILADAPVQITYRVLTGLAWR